MQKFMNSLLKLGIVLNTKGQDLVEYALMAGFVTVTAGALMPNISTSVSQIFSQIGSVMTGSASQG